mgnify:CR=1 FL=1
MINLVLFHAKSVKPFRPCMDGLFAAWAAQLRFPQAKLIPACYGTPPILKLKKGDRIFLLDLTYPAPILESWADTGADVVVLDHHKQAMQDLQYLGDRVYKIFDMNRSGAVIAWEFFHPEIEAPKLFHYVQDRDLWTKQLPGCDLVSLGLGEKLDDLAVEQAIALLPSLKVDELMMLGATANEEVKAAIAYAVAHHSTRCVIGNVVPFFKCRTPRQNQAYSDIGHALCQANPKAPFAVVQTGGGWALRSENDRADVSAISKMMGGGGHRNASGCRAELPC